LGWWGLGLVVECCAWINLIVLCGAVVIFYDFFDGGCPFL